MKTRYALIAGALAAALGAGCAPSTESSYSTPAQAPEPAPPFGGAGDVRYAQHLWQALAVADLVGPGAMESTPYTGQHPHGAILQNVDLTLTVDGVTGPAIVKRNYGGEGVSKAAVANDPDRYLKAVTVMFQRRGYDPENNDWFWAKYRPDGSLDTNPKGMQLAGRVAKGNTEAGCIACHSAAPGGDLVFTHDRFGR